MNYKAPAKLNLFLHINKRRCDGYHELQTLFQLIDYCDELSFELRSGGEININCNIDIPYHDNLVFKAARLLQKYRGVSVGADIYLHKHIALGAGLGGGSSNAATTLKALNRLWDCRLDNKQLMACGKELGADVPLFIAGHSAWGEGIGDSLQAVDLPPRWYTVFIPPYRCDTQLMYQAAKLKRDCTVVSIEDYFAGRTINVFEAVIRHRYPLIADAMDWLNDRSTAYLSGSGGAFFAVSETEQQAIALSEDHPSYLQSFIARGINQSPT
ncbi:MAG: 4-(cytidine 5'-diphospho)-2-C-methyl-D-erythritol kinase [Chromatiales bacterium]|nr:4-(cytidine 5'-diphospho)-2-C-methyl-D-erythritol kinase [Chromatiales bacterium]